MYEYVEYVLAWRRIGSGERFLSVQVLYQKWLEQTFKLNESTHRRKEKTNLSRGRVARV